MKLKTEIVRSIKREITIDQKEANVILLCLDYSYHRITKHNKQVADLEDVDKIRAELRRMLTEPILHV